MRHPGWLALLLVMGACSRPVAPPPPDMVRTVAVLAPELGAASPAAAAHPDAHEPETLHTARIAPRPAAVNRIGPCRGRSAVAEVVDVGEQDRGITPDSH